MAELLGDKDNWWHRTVRQASEKWTAKEWRKVYGFSREGEGMASRTNCFIDSKFSARVNPMDGFVVSECKEVRARKVLEFLVPFLYPKKPTRISITVGNTIFRAFSRERPVDWGQVVKDIVQRLFAGMGKSKATPICPYIFHMYRITKALLKHNVKPEEEEVPKVPEASEDSDRESLSSKEIQEIQRQEFAWMKKSPRNKRGSPATKDPMERHKTPTLLERAEQNYQAIANNLKDIRDREHAQGELIQALYKKLGNIKSDELEVAIDSMPTQKRMDKLEAKNSFLLEKTIKLQSDLKETKKDHHEAVDKLNATLQFNQKLEEYVDNSGDVVNKARLFDENLARNPVSAGKVIPILVDFAKKMEEVLNEMRVLFEGLQPEVIPVAAENLPDILGEIPSLTGWGRETTPMEMPTREEEMPTQPEYESLLRRRVAEPAATRREVSINTIVEEVVRKLDEERSQANRVETPQLPARIDVVQIGPKEPLAERMRELSTPPEGSTPEPITFFTPRPLTSLCPSFISELERITKSHFKTLGTIPSGRLPILISTPENTGPDTRDKLEPSGSGRTSGEGAEVIEASSRATRVTRFAAKLTPRGSTSSLPKRPILSPANGSSSKRPKK